MARLPINVEPSAYRRGEYVAYDPRGNVWHVAKAVGEWRARPAANNPAREIGITIAGSSLTAVASTIANRKPAPALLPF